MNTSTQISRMALKSYFTVLNRSVDVKGVEVLPKGPKIIAMNHTPGCDPLYLPLVLDDTPRFLLQDAYFRIPVISSILKNSGQIPVYRGTDRAKEAKEQACEVLRAGGTIAIFPEGKDVELGTRIPAKTGVVRMALETGAPIIPLGLFAPKQSLTPLEFQWEGRRRCGSWQFSGRSYMHFGLPWRPNPSADLHVQTEELMKRIYSLVADAARQSERGPASMLNLVHQA